MNVSHSLRSFLLLFIEMQNKKDRSSPEILQSELPSFIIKISTQCYYDLK